LGPRETLGWQRLKENGKSWFGTAELKRRQAIDVEEDRHRRVGHDFKTAVTRGCEDKDPPSAKLRRR